MNPTSNATPGPLREVWRRRKIEGWTALAPRLVGARQRLRARPSGRRQHENSDRDCHGAKESGMRPDGWCHCPGSRSDYCVTTTDCR